LLQFINFIRHAHAAKGDDGSDESRQLTDVGASQARHRRLALGNPTYDLLLASPMKRAVSTMALVGDVSAERIHIVPELYPDPKRDPLGTRLDALFHKPKLGYAPVSKYLKAKGGSAVLEHGAIAWKALAAQIESSRWFRIGICGHAVSLPAIGIAACGPHPQTDHFRQQLLEANLGEAEGFAMLLKEGCVIDFHFFE
jgi:hypothetical protein